MIAPAILTDDNNKFKEMISFCSDFAQILQIDIMDGQFVSSSSVGKDEISAISPTVKTEAHLMVNDPISWLDSFKKMGSFRIIYHYEIDADHEKIIATIKDNGFEVGLAINPGTKLDEFRHLVDKLDMVLFMSVIPGFYGAPFIPEVLEKIKAFKKEFPGKIVSIDGGVKIDNFQDIKNSGVDIICVGSAILKAEDPKQAYLKFLELFNE